MILQEFLFFLSSKIFHFLGSSKQRESLTKKSKRIQLGKRMLSWENIPKNPVEKKRLKSPISHQDPRENQTVFHHTTRNTSKGILRGISVPGYSCSHQHHWRQHMCLMVFALVHFTSRTKKFTKIALSHQTGNRKKRCKCCLEHWLTETDSRRACMHLPRRHAFGSLSLIHNWKEYPKHSLFCSPITLAWRSVNTIKNTWMLVDTLF